MNGLSTTGPSDGCPTGDRLRRADDAKNFLEPFIEPIHRNLPAYFGHQTT
jgi:hypothetical protein